jgi:hypothetical protein
MARVGIQDKAVSMNPILTLLIRNLEELNRSLRKIYISNIHNSKSHKYYIITELHKP